MQQRQAHSRLHLLAASERLQLRLFGDFELHYGTLPSQPLPKKARALFAYLAMHPDRSIPREQLATLLWGDSQDKQARRSLRGCLMAIRTALGSKMSTALAGEGATVRLDPEQVEIDVRRFEVLSRSATVGALRAASELYRDEFLFGIQIASEPFAEWLALERRRLASLMSDVGYRLATTLAQADDINEAITAAKRLTTIDPLREDAHRLLIRLLAVAGQRGPALKQYAYCADLLRRELGVAPERDTTNLADAIRHGHMSGARFVDVKTSEAPVMITPALSPEIPDKLSIAVIPFSISAMTPAKTILPMASPKNSRQRLAAYPGFSWLGAAQPRLIEEARSIFAGPVANWGSAISFAAASAGTTTVCVLSHSY